MVRHNRNNRYLQDNADGSNKANKRDRADRSQLDYDRPGSNAISGSIGKIVRERWGEVVEYEHGGGSE